MAITSSTSTNRERLSGSAIHSQMRTEFQKFVEQYHIPGLAYGLVVEADLVAAGGMGLQNITNNLPVSPDTLFRIASMTKSFTAMAVIKLRDEGKLRLDGAVEEIVPEVRHLSYPTKDSPLITVRHLLTMSAGFPQDDPWADRQLASSETDLSEWLRSGISFSNPPGVAYEYSNYGYAILGRIVTNVSGIPYQTYIQENILKPLEMTSTTFDIRSIEPGRLAMGYRREDDQWIAEQPLPDGAFASMGGIFTTITDFARYISFLLAAFPPRDDVETGPVRRSSVREMQQIWRHGFVTSMRQTPNSAALVQGGGYGYGLQSTIDSVLGFSVAHGGGLPGYGTFYRLLPDYGVGLVAFTNLTYARASLPLDDILYTLRKNGSLAPRPLTPTDQLLDIQRILTQLYDQWSDKVMLSTSTESFFQDMPLEKRRQQFAELRENLGKRLSISPVEPQNALRGRWSMQCSKGRIHLFATLAPTIPPRLQYLQITSARSLSPAFKKMAKQMVSLINQWVNEQAALIFDRRLKASTLHPQVDALRALYGKIQLGEVLEGDGKTTARLRLLGKQGMVDMKLTLNPKNGKVLDVVFTRPQETAFVL